MVPKELHVKTKPQSPGTLAREGPGTEQWHQDGSQTRSSIRVGDQVPRQEDFFLKKTYNLDGLNRSETLETIFSDEITNIVDYSSISRAY